jgi:cytochrome bd-type quinol oxidase subunit 2
VRRAQQVSLIVAVAWGLLLVVAALVAPVYSTQTSAGSGDRLSTAVPGSATLVQVNGWRVLLVCAVPLACAALVGVLLWRRAGKPGAGPVAWTVTAVLAGLNLLAMLSIGVFVLPVTAALVIACISHRAERQPARQPARQHS